MREGHYILSRDGKPSDIVYVNQFNGFDVMWVPGPEDTPARIRVGDALRGPIDLDALWASLPRTP